GAGEAQLVAPTLNRFDEGPAPSAETDDGGVDHRRATQFLGARGTEGLVGERKDLMPTVDRLLGPIIRTIVCEECGAGAVKRVELVIRAEPLQRGLGAVDLVGGGVGVLVAE